MAHGYSHPHQRKPLPILSITLMAHDRSSIAIAKYTIINVSTDQTKILGPARAKRSAFQPRSRSAILSMMGDFVNFFKESTKYFQGKYCSSHGSCSSVFVKSISLH
jgi:hypothetical protein